MLPTDFIVTHCGFFYGFNSRQVNFGRSAAFGLFLFDSYYDYSHSFLLRFENVLVAFFGPNVSLDYLNTKIARRIDKRYHKYIYEEKHSNLSIYWGAEGIIPPGSIPVSHKLIYPLSKQENLKLTMELPKEISNFINNH